MDDELNKNDIIREGFTNLQLSKIWLRNETKVVRKMGKKYQLSTTIRVEQRGYGHILNYIVSSPFLPA